MAEASCCRQVSRSFAIPLRCQMGLLRVVVLHSRGRSLHASAVSLGVWASGRAA